METVEWLVGIIAGDGRISDRYVRVYNNDKAIIQKCTRIFYQSFGLQEGKIKFRTLKKDRNGFTRNSETIEITVNSQALASNLRKLKRTLLQKPADDFISGLFDAEGSIDLRGTITLWQRKDNQGKEIVQSIRKWLDRNEIDFVEVKNMDFYIIEILGSYKNYTNLKKFSSLVNLSVERKVKDLELILDIFSRRNLISREDVFQFVKMQNSVTVRDIIENFHIPKMNAYSALNKLVKENRIIKIKSYPDHYAYPAGILR